MAINIDDYCMVATNPNSGPHEGGASVVGKQDVGTFREMMLLRGLLFEAAHPGMRLTAKAPKCTTIVRREYGFKGNNQKLALQLVKDMIARGVIRKRTEEDAE